jgi:hypothetical protein
MTHSAALAAVMISFPPLPAAITGVGLVLSGIHYLRVALHRSPKAVVGLELANDGRIACLGPDGEWRAAILRTAVVPAFWLAALTLFDSTGVRRTVVIVPDAVDAAPFRRLRVWLLWRGAKMPAVAGRAVDGQ